MDRVERKRFERAIPDLNAYYNDREIGFFMPGEEDFGIDIPTTGISLTGRKVSTKTELKTIKSTYGYVFGSFYRHKACRIPRIWRYGLTADTNATQEEIENDRTPAPLWTMTDKPLHVLNAADKYGNRDNSKVSELFRNKYAVVFMFSDGYLVFSAKDLKKSIVGYAWQWLPHTQELGDSSERWELKAVIDMEGYTRWIKSDIPEEILEDD